MDNSQAAKGDRSGPNGGGPFLGVRSAVWLTTSLLLGGAVAWIAVVGQSYFAPLGVFPLLVGVVLGALLVGLLRVCQTGHRPTILFAALAAVAVTVVGQHYVGYRAACRHARQETQEYRDARLAFPPELRDRAPSPNTPPADFADFLRTEAARGRKLLGGYVARGWMAWLTWAVDGLLSAAAAVAMIIPAMRQPYCRRCRSWYRVIRSGRIDVTTARRLAEVAEVAEVSAADHATAARYRLLSCQGGCGPTGFHLSWDKSPGGTSSVRTWLDVERRNRIAQVLDKASGDDDD